MTKARFGAAQKLGRSLMLPIAVLPVAGLLLRLGQPDLLNVKVIAQAGDAIFGNLALVFAIGVAVGFARDNAGVAGLAGGIGYLVTTAIVKTMGEKNDPGVLAGILAGVVAGALYNRYAGVKLPDYLAFFGGKRFVPIVTGFACLLLGVALGVIWSPVQRGIDALGHWLIGAGAIGLFAYGVLNRLLLVTGLHHVLNSLVWFVFGNYEAGGKIVTGDLHRFFAGDPTAGAFMTGFFPIMMFGLPAACLAMYRTARPENRRAVGGMLLSMALTSLLTGVTEPIEFTFMFLAPELFALHALLTGASMALMATLHVRLGFTFSAGAFDYLLSYGLSSRGWLLLPVGLATFAVYYGVFDVAIRRLNLATPGRDGAVAREATVGVDASDRDRALAFLRALGGAENVRSIDACTTRLRLTIAARGRVRDAELRALGAKGIVAPSEGTLQVVLGPEADRVADLIRGVMGGGEAADRPSASGVTETAGVGAIDRAAWRAALGGEANLRAIEAVATTRLRVEVADASRLDEAALTRLGARGVMRFSPTLAHVLVGPAAKEIAAALQGGAPELLATAIAAT